MGCGIIDTMQEILVTDKEKVKAQLVVEMETVLKDYPSISNYIRRDMQSLYFREGSIPMFGEDNKLLGHEPETAIMRDIFFIGHRPEERVGNILHRAAKMLSTPPNPGLAERIIGRKERKSNEHFESKIYGWNNDNNPDLVKKGIFTENGQGILVNPYAGLIIVEANVAPIKEHKQFYIDIGKAVFSALENGLSPQVIVDALDEKQDIATALGISKEEILEKALAGKLDRNKLLDVLKNRMFEALIPILGASIPVFPRRDIGDY